MFLFQNKNLRIIINVKHGKLMSPERVELSTLGLQVTGAYKNQFQICCNMYMYFKNINFLNFQTMYQSPAQTHSPKPLYVKNGAMY